MCRPLKTWFLLATVAVLVGSLPCPVLAGGDAKAGAKPLPEDVVKAWTDAGADVGWMQVDEIGLQFSRDKSAPAGAVPAFNLSYRDWKVNTLAKLPDPGAPFGLSLFDTKVTDSGLKELAGLTSLQSLDLGYSQVTDAGLKELARLKTLQSLCLVRTKVTDAGLKELAGLNSLQSLDLFGTQVTDVGLKEVAGLKSLQSLVLNATKVTNAGVERLKKELPGCRISR